MQGQALPFARTQDVAVPRSDEARVIEALRELTRSGYVADPDAPAEGQGILLRHDSAPDLVLNGDGRIELPLRPLPKQGQSRKGKGDRRISWRRTFLVFIIAMIAWTLSVLLGVALLSS